MAYIIKVKNREGRHYVYLVEGYRENGKVKQRRLKNYGSWEEMERKEPGAFERLKQEAKDGLIGKEETNELVVTYDLQAPIQAADQLYGWKLLDGLYRELGLSNLLMRIQKSKNIRYDLNKILQLLVFQRILNPQSKLATVDAQHTLWGDWQLTQNAVYRSLDILNEAKQAIQGQVHQHITSLFGRTAYLVFYDVTNYYFETDVDDTDLLQEGGTVIAEGLRRRGPSKEHRPNPIVQLGLFMDTNGIPISYQLFRGNQTDPITYLPALEQLKAQFGIERLIVVADKAMNSKSNVSQTYANGDGWLFSQKHRGKNGVSKEIQAFILDAADWEYNESLTFAKKSILRERKLADGTMVKEKVLVTWNKKYAVREKIRRDGALEYAKKLTNAELFRQTAKRGGKKYLQLFTVDPGTGEKLPFRPFISIQEDEVIFDSHFDGVNVLVTSETEMSDEDMLSQYKELGKIEDCFHITKSEFNSRPVFVWKKEHIEAHFLTCFLALVLMRCMQHVTQQKLSPHRLVKALQSARVMAVQNGFYRVQANEDLQVLHESLGIRWDKGIVKTEDLNHYGTGWLTTAKKA